MAAPICAVEFFAGLPPVWPCDVRSRLADVIGERTLVVLDDDPTGTQTVHDVPVLTSWDVEELVRELGNRGQCFYILTNSRSLPPEAAADLTQEVAANLKIAAARTGREITPVSRSDSTLRGHYPLETDILNQTLGPFDATFLCFYFEAGGRYTIGDVHYVAEGDRLLAAGDTPFAEDRAFGYTNSDLRLWVEEKTRSRISATSVRSLSLEVIRNGGPEAVCDEILKLPRGAVCIVNSAHPRDMDVFAAGVAAAEATGRRYLFRSAAQLVAARLGQDPQRLWMPPPAGSSGLVIVGSYVPKTTEQLSRLLADRDIFRQELDVSELLGAGRQQLINAVAAQVDTWLGSGCDTVIYTSRTLARSINARDSLEQGQRISDALVEVVTRLRVRPGYLIAKGGITSSDIATRALGVRRAMVLGQIAPGIPVWQTGAETLFPGLPYVIFPGNVGGPEALLDVVNTLRRQNDGTPMKNNVSNV